MHHSYLSSLLHTAPVAVLEVLLFVVNHPELEAVPVLDPAHEAEVPGLGDGGGARGPGPAQGSVGGEQLGVSRLIIHQHQGPVGVQRLLVVSENKLMNQ